MKGLLELKGLIDGASKYLKDNFTREEKQSYYMFKVQYHLDQANMYRKLAQKKMDKERRA